jgi:predicted AAA+ superfamily ATPase
MDVEYIKRIVRDQEEETKDTFKKEKIVNRECENQHLLKSNLLVILGVRRAGKSTLAHLLLKGKKYAAINFDDERLFGIEIGEMDKILDAIYQLYGEIKYIILDEPQNVLGWELFVNRLQRRKKLIVTGSNAKLMGKELATHLTGRYTDFTLYPFSFREFLRYKDFTLDLYLTESIAQTKKYLKEYTENGGLPESFMMGKRYVLRLYEDIITKDIISRYRIRYNRDMKELAKYLVSNVASEFTFNRLKKMLDVKSVHTVKNYIDYLESSYLLFVIERFSYKLKQQMKAPKKVYAVDTGIANIGFRISPDYGKLMENLVAIELLRKKSIEPLIELYYWKDYRHREVDFVLKKGAKIKQLIQVCYGIDDSSTKEREVNSLLRASQELKCNNLLVITQEFEGKESKNGKQITFIPLWKWLLSGR